MYIRLMMLLLVPLASCTLKTDAFQPIDTPDSGPPAEHAHDWSDVTTGPQDGKVGIGTSEPAGVLEPAGGGNLLVDVLILADGCDTPGRVVLLAGRDYSIARPGDVFIDDFGERFSIASVDANELWFVDDTAACRVSDTDNATIHRNALIAQDGNVGFGTSGPRTRFEVRGGTLLTGEDPTIGYSVLTARSSNGTFGGGAAIVNIEQEASSGFYFFLRARSTNGGIGAGATDRFTVSQGGDVDITGTYLTDGADYAEYFLTAKPCRVHEVVSLDESKRIRPAMRGDGFVVGVVSHKPSILGNRQLARAHPTQVKPVALVGRVLARVGGEVRFGDRLGVSSVPGQLERARPGDDVVGRAMESQKSGDGLLEVLIR